MKLIAALAALALTSLPAAAGTKQDKENKEQLAQVSRIYVAGEGPNIEKVRDFIGRAKSCFVLTETRDGSDATLYVTTPGSRSGGQSISFQAATEGVQGELKKDSVTIWTGEGQFVGSSDHTMGVGMAIASLVNSLEHDAGCGKKKGALAQGHK